MDQAAESTPREYVEEFGYVFYVMEAVGGILIALVASWVFFFRGGLAWTSDPSHQFNWHPLLMTIGLVFLYANGMLMYRSQRSLRKSNLKLLHGGIMLFILLLTSVASLAVFDMHNLSVPPIPNLYSLHSWVGLTTIILFICQWIFGLVSFLYPGVRASLRTTILPFHTYFGMAGFIGAIASCLLGLNEKAIFALTPQVYSQLPKEGLLINVIGLVFIVFGTLTIYLVSQERYRRHPRPEDSVLLSRNNSD